MKTRYIVGFFVLFLSVTGIIAMSYQYTYDRTMEEQFAKDEISGEMAETESIAAKGNAVNESSGDNDGFYLQELHGFVVVYLKDQKTIYEFTEIPVTDLPYEVQQEVSEGKYIATEQELYAFLENYSS